MRKIHLAMAGFCMILMFSASSYAAKPVSVKQKGKSTSESGESYVVFQVKCSNGANKLISAWNSKKLWCAGKEAKADCNKKQIKTAKSVCRNS